MYKKDKKIIKIVKKGNIEQKAAKQYKWWSE